MTGPRAALDAISRIQRSGRNPLAIYLLALCITAGLSFIAGIIAGGDGMSAVERLMPGALVIGWYVLLFTGGVVAVTGIALRDLVTSLLVERAGLVALVPSGTVYAGALFTLGQIYAGATVALFAFACLCRTLQIHRELAAIRGKR